MSTFIGKFKQYFNLIKSLQTALLTITGVAGFFSARIPLPDWLVLILMIISLVCAISGSTVLNMWYDHDIDKVMDRTHHRPLAQGRIPKKNALLFGTILSVLGVGMGIFMSPLFGLLLFAGIFFDFAIYTLWLKRRTCWCIVWGGLAGGMPILAGRALALGYIDGIGILLSLSVLFWIPTHMLTFSMRYAEDYRMAKIPTFPSTYGNAVTRRMIAISSILAGGLISLAAVMIGVRQGLMHTLNVLSIVLTIWSFLVMIKPSKIVNFGLFKYASVYMLAAMLLLAI